MLVEGFDAELPVEQAWTPPSSWYVEEAFAAREAETVFRHSWICAGRLDALPGPGSFVAGSIGPQQHVVLRDGAGQLRAFHNVCRHHAAQLVAGEGSCERLVCPYHGWTYSLEGRLERAPRSGGIAGFDRDDFGLVPLSVASYGPWAFLHAGDPSGSLSEDLAGLDRVLGDLSGFRFVERREYRLQCNWKVFVDNYLDGGYHVPVLHRALGEQLDLTTYRTELAERYVVQYCDGGKSQSADHGDSAARIGDGAVYAWIYPNLMINRYGPITDTNLVVPISAGECKVVFEWLIETDKAHDASFVEHSLEASERVQLEDQQICESVQRGLRSAAYDRGRYAPRLEMGEHHFHRLVATDLAQGNLK